MKTLPCYGSACNVDKPRYKVWLKNLSPLIHYEDDELFSKKTHAKPTLYGMDKSGKKRYFIDGPSRDPHLRSKFWPGIAKAMSIQWG